MALDYTKEVGIFFPRMRFEWEVYMENGKCCSGGKCCGPASLCPVSFGLALGITCALAVIVWSAWVMYFGMPEMMEGMKMMVPDTWMGVLKHSLLCLVKGFIFGFVLVVIYDFVVCCGKKFCCRKDK